MPYQTSGNVLAAIKRETTTGVAATAASAVQIRATDSQGLEFKRAQIQSNEKRDDALKTMARIGGKMVDGSFNAELTIGGATDIVLEAIQRGVWSTATSIAFASVTSITTGTNTIVANGGDWVGGQGLRVGDIFYLTNHSTSANNNVNLRIIAISSLTITVPLGSLTTDAVADATGTLTRLKKVTNPTTPTRYSHTIEQYDQDIDISELFLGCRAVGVRLSFRPGQMATATYSFMGMDRTALTTGTSPWFTSPSPTTGLGLIADDCIILKDGVAVTTFTGLDLDLQITARGEPVIGAFVSPDIFDNDLSITGQVTALRSDFANLTLFDAETEFSLAVRLEEPGSTPKSCLGVYLPRVKIGALSAPFGGGDGAKVETLGLLIGPKVAATGHDGSAIIFHSSAA